MKHAYVKLEKDGHVSLCWWVDAGDGVATRAVIHVQPGERAFDLGFEEWRQRAGTFVDLDEVHRHLVLGSIRN
ncbi:MAG: hypothetical protein H7066_18675 [Cytophagaceae bacterium]|nr:hypothetical protein [Gemmatimonadaceae bacterium]